ncbi:hypothetical protein Agabi119p4_10274 [Agaricus bisporus var. burnettii]|uniref:Uncharacterized protein n=1 Tax=Agaricus bisporus var. burnettii TaxID=192524 RepID=A0A8H7C2L7_AGABI|nr:hypothetical protein Agabi119p4_10274 [Agaricus bisporus var. burnettii]
MAIWCEAYLSFQKSKLLKSGKSYALGRKSQPLIVGSKKVSQEHCLFNVGEYTLDDVHNPERRPKLEFVSKRDKPMRLMRGDEQLVAGAHCTTELRDGDVVHIVTGLPMSVKWQQICCYSPNLRGKPTLSLETCAQLGISIVYTPSAQVTHHLIPTYVANASIAASLISAAQFVKFEWLHEILKSSDALEEKFVLPTISKYRPTFSPSLSPSQKVFKVWEPNEERINMFAEYRFLVLGEKTRDMDGDLRTLIKRGEGAIDTFDIAGGVTKLHKALTRGQAKENQQLVVVADVKDVKACIGEDEWKKLVVEVESFDLHITYPETVVQSVLDVEPALLTAQQPTPFNLDALDNGSIRSLPAVVLNSMPDEPSVPPEEPPRRRLSRRATSRQPSVEPTSQPDVEEIKTESPKHRRKLLLRRGRTAEPEEKPVDATTVPPAAPSSRLRLKRRLGAAPTSEASNARAQSQLPDLEMASENEPPLKKFKALFDASDPTRSGAGSYDEDAIMGTASSPTQSQTQGFVRRPAAGSSLNALREEEEELEESTQSAARGVKRPLDVVREEDGDVEMVGIGAEGDEPPRKKQALNNSESAQHEATTSEPPKSNKKDKERDPGAPVGKPDTDAGFLKAVASTKKGKRTEDAFDREFNKLRISKPKPEDVQRQERDEEEEWRKFTDFGDDADLRGNFMVVMEMNVYRNDEGGSTPVGMGRGTRNKELPEEWRDKPNFKKFKKKLSPVRRAFIELVINDDVDFDTRPRRTQKQLKPQRTTSSSRMEIESESQSIPLRPASRNTIVVDSSDEEQKPRIGKFSTLKTMPPSRAGSRAPSKAITSNPPSRTGSVTAAKSHQPALFLISDDENDGLGDEVQSQNNPRGDGDEYGDDDQTLRSSTAAKAPTRSPERSRTTTTGRRTTRRSAADDSDDDGAVFKGFGAGRRKR